MAPPLLFCSPPPPLPKVSDQSLMGQFWSGRGQSSGLLWAKSSLLCTKSSLLCAKSVPELIWFALLSFPIQSKEGLTYQCAYSIVTAICPGLPVRGRQGSLYQGTYHHCKYQQTRVICQHSSQYINSTNWI